jgi:hypothetical protein
MWGAVKKTPRSISGLHREGKAQARLFTPAD